MESRSDIFHLPTPPPSLPSTMSSSSSTISTVSVLEQPGSSSSVSANTRSKKRPPSGNTQSKQKIAVLPPTFEPKKKRKKDDPCIGRMHGGIGVRYKLPLNKRKQEKKTLTPIAEAEAEDPKIDVDEPDQRSFPDECWSTPLAKVSVGVASWWG